MCRTGGNGLSPLQYRNNNTYLCGKIWDFGETITHEIGHAVAYLAHAEEVDVHLGNSNATSAASCSNFSSRATVCNGPKEWYTGRRSLSSYDRESLRRDYVYQAGGSP